MARAEPPDPPATRHPAAETYQVRVLPKASIRLDGRADEPVWQMAAVEKRFRFPWKTEVAPATEFRALCDAKNLYFHFQVADPDLVLLERLRDEQDAVFEDRVEIYLSLDDQMQDYFCFEVDARGRVFDYRASFYRRFDPKWKFRGLAAKGLTFPGGYSVEGRLPLRRLVALGFPWPRPGVKIRCGLYRAEFSHDRTGHAGAARASLHTLGRSLAGPPPLEAWISWVDPHTPEPDFHVPASLGWLEFVR